MARTLSWLGLWAPLICRMQSIRLSRRAMTFDMASLVVGILLVMQFGFSSSRSVQALPYMQMAALDKCSASLDWCAVMLSTYRERATIEGGFASNETLDGMIATAYVLKNRLLTGVHQDGQPVPKTYRDVVWAPKQLSWTAWKYTPKYRVVPRNYVALVMAGVAAYAVVNDTPRGLAVRRVIGPADHYFNPQRVTPGWAKGMEDRGMVGYHRFMVDHKRDSLLRTCVEWIYWLKTREVPNGNLRVALD